MTNVLARREGEQRSGGVVQKKLGAPRPPLRDSARSRRLPTQPASSWQPSPAGMCEDVSP